ncbi:ALP1-like protein [Tanacetum coccineum]|uniref:ALP1-like protein n=1 Tax=Tanacetum coccineum TaxID=301880 RepID=A0ABQ4ZR26_9ASTR
MDRPLFNWIVEEVTIHCPFFRNNIDCTRREGIFPLMKCTATICQLAYDTVPDPLDKYLQMIKKTSRLSLDHFCNSVMKIFRPEYLRKPTMTDVVKLYRHYEETHEFRGMLRSLDCIDWEWFGCPDAYKGQNVKRDHGSNPFILLKVVASQDLWILMRSLGWLLEEIHVTWAHFEKKQTRLRLYTKSLEEYAYNAWRRRRNFLRRHHIIQETASGISRRRQNVTASKETLEDSAKRQR